MADRWELFKSIWGTGDEEAPITDASTAEDSLVEDAITRFQAMSKEITDILVSLSAARADVDDTLRKLREAVTLAYSYSLDNRVEEIQTVLRKVLDL